MPAAGSSTQDGGFSDADRSGKAILAAILNCTPPESLSIEEAGALVVACRLIDATPIIVRLPQYFAPMLRMATAMQVRFQHCLFMTCTVHRHACPCNNRRRRAHMRMSTYA